MGRRAGLNSMGRVRTDVGARRCKEGQCEVRPLRCGEQTTVHNSSFNGFATLLLGAKVAHTCASPQHVKLPVW
jgi:hypothetical protein